MYEITEKGIAPDFHCEKDFTTVFKKIQEYISEAVPENMKIPTVEGLCLKLGIHRDTLYEWAKQNKTLRTKLRELPALDFLNCPLSTRSGLNPDNTNAG